MSLSAYCPECDGRSTKAGGDQRGAIYLCESTDRACAVFDHWDDDVRTYRARYRGGYQAMDDEE